MLSIFIEWAKQIAEAIHTENVKTLLTEGDKTDNPSARLDIDTPMAVARITCWESSNYYAEILDLATEKTVFSNHGNLQNGDMLSV